MFKGRQGFFLFVFFLTISKRYCKSGFCYLSREGQKIYHKGFCYAKYFASFLFRLINANISVNDKGGYTVLPLSVCPSILLSFHASKIFFVAFFSVTVDGRNLIFGHKHHISIPYCG